MNNSLPFKSSTHAPLIKSNYCHLWL